MTSAESWGKLSLHKRPRYWLNKRKCWPWSLGMLLSRNWTIKKTQNEITKYVSRGKYCNQRSTERCWEMSVSFGGGFHLMVLMWWDSEGRISREACSFVDIYVFFPIEWAVLLFLSQYFQTFSQSCWQTTQRIADNTMQSAQSSCWLCWLETDTSLIVGHRQWAGPNYSMGYAV